MLFYYFRSSQLYNTGPAGITGESTVRSFLLQIILKGRVSRDFKDIKLHSLYAIFSFTIPMYLRYIHSYFIYKYLVCSCIWDEKKLNISLYFPFNILFLICILLILSNVTLLSLPEDFVLTSVTRHTAQPFSQLLLLVGGKGNQHFQTKSFRQPVNLIQLLLLREHLNNINII